MAGVEWILEVHVTDPINFWELALFGFCCCLFGENL